MQTPARGVVALKQRRTERREPLIGRSGVV